MSQCRHSRFERLLVRVWQLFCVMSIYSMQRCSAFCAHVVHVNVPMVVLVRPYRVRDTSEYVCARVRARGGACGKREVVSETPSMMFLRVFYIIDDCTS